MCENKSSKCGNGFSIVLVLFILLAIIISSAFSY